ncbi:MAG: ATP synthase F1 subunit gamma [Bacteroidales bacterium]|nr:ATP synthase F1 subunit gamma [Bacteroidales bacterium]
MPNLKEIRIRLQSVKSTRQITSAMKMVSAAKLRKAQDAIIQMRPYAGKLQEILGNLSGSLSDSEISPFTQVREVKKVLLVVITSNRGLCGAFNSNVVKKCLQVIDEKYLTLYKNGNLDVIAIGKKGADLLKSRKFPAKESYNDIYEKLTFDEVIPIAQSIMNEFASGKYDEVFLIYNQFRNAATQILTNERFLPVKPVDDGDTLQNGVQTDYILEPSKEEIVRELIPKSLKIQFFKALLDSFASEHGARMTAMHKATDNATELIRELQLTYNKARQTTITKEILEIVSGAEALKG